MSTPDTTPTPQQEPPIRLFPAFCSMLLPGLGQLLQKRGNAFFVQLLIYAITAAIPYGAIRDFFYSLSYSTFEIIPFLVLLIFPVMVIFLSVLDVIYWKPGEDSRLLKPFCNLIIFFIFVYIMIGLFNVHGCTRVAAQRMHCSNNMRQIVFGLHAYYDTYKCLPPAYIVDADGQPLHSWRVLILPFIEAEELYKQIRLDEAWDSEYNQQFHSKMPKLFRCGSIEQRGVIGMLKRLYPNVETGCCYSIVVGSKTPFNGSKSSTFEQITDGLSNTIFLVERMVSVNWMNPTSEITFESACCGINTELTGIGSGHYSGCNYCTGAIAVRFASGDIDSKELKAMLTIADGDGEK
ncbi:MAG: DUF1559 domain-containing protein [Planctomycetaceae bacterium]|jgi:hypothetical protein|nr:DUF1559 domain-containing protein [Planctomycetaceae bacterium]